MVAAMKAIATSDVELTVQERDLLSAAYKASVGSRRSSWRKVSNIEQKELQKELVQCSHEYKVKIEEELTNLCKEIISILDQHLINSTTSLESKVLYLKMKADYHRYLAEFAHSSDRKAAAENSLIIYKSSLDLAIQNLKPTNPIRLGLALNFAVFYYEILNSTDHACNLAKQAFDDCMAELDTLSEEAYNESSAIMQLLRDNLTLWTAETKST